MFVHGFSDEFWHVDAVDNQIIGINVRQQDLNQASPVLVFYTWHCTAGHEYFKTR